jgi:hypothetical protein
MSSVKPTKDILFASFEEVLTKKLPLEKQSHIRKIAEELSVIGNDVSVENSKTFSKLYSEVSYKSESHKNLFRQHIELISKHSNKLMAELKRNNFVQFRSEKNSSEKKLVGKTIFANSLVIFLDELDESVRKFYTDVYEIKDEDEAKRSGFEQTSLF